MYIYLLLHVCVCACQTGLFIYLLILFFMVIAFVGTSAIASNALQGMFYNVLLLWFFSVVVLLPMSFWTFRLGSRVCICIVLFVII
jgi:hypothetical protein